MNLMPSRAQKLLRCIDAANQVGVEIGALDKPIVTREMGQVYYVDHDTTETLRNRFADPSHNIDLQKIVEVDYIWGEKGLSELFQDQAAFDYVIASHVVEHVPDLVGWLSEIRSILKPGGILSLAVPDKRQCFDYQRPVSRLPEVTEAYLHHSRKPSPQQIFDQVNSAVSYRGSTAWSGTIDTSKLSRISSTQDALNVAKTAFTSGEYCDVHCWVFTPASFLELLSNMAALDLLKFEITEFYGTKGCEFFVSLRATDQAHPTEIKHFAKSRSHEVFAFPMRFAETIVQELRFLKRKLKGLGIIKSKK
jgi:SAM-dependent methyltransferase